MANFKGYDNARVDALIFQANALRDFTQADLLALLVAVADQAGMSVETQSAIEKLVAKEQR